MMMGRASGLGYLMILGGAVLAYNCLRGFFEPPGFDQQERGTFLVSMGLGMFLGLGLVALGVAWINMLHDY
jgi:hypothetical protein